MSSFFAAVVSFLLLLGITHSTATKGGTNVGTDAVAAAGIVGQVNCCGAIGGFCQNVFFRCSGNRKYYSGFCSSPGQSCCAPITDERRCGRIGGECLYVCQGTNFPSLCGGHLSCCLQRK